MLSLNSRMKSIIRDWPIPLARDFRQYISKLNKSNRPKRRRIVHESNLPYWLALPSWLADLYNRGRRDKPIPGRFINDILWGQYCLFLVIRIQDDLYDGQAEHKSLVYAADSLIAEAYDTFLKHLNENGRFRTILRDSLQETSNAIIEVDRLQQDPKADLNEIFSGYARVASIFKVGSAAVCCKAGKLTDYRKISRFSDTMASIGQVFDDFEDIKEDLDRGRLNYVALYFLRYDNDKRAKKNEALKQISRNMVFTDSVSSLLNELRSRLRKCERTMAPLKMKGVSEYIKTYFKALDNMAYFINQKRIKIVFGKRAAYLSRPSNKK